MRVKFFINNKEVKHLLVNLISLMIVCLCETSVEVDYRNFSDVDCAIACGTRRKLNNELEGEIHDFY